MEKTVNDFIKELQSVSPEKRELPLYVRCPNGELTSPSIKMVKDVSLFDPPTGMIITWL